VSRSLPGRIAARNDSGIRLSRDDRGRTNVSGEQTRRDVLVRIHPVASAIPGTGERNRPASEAFVRNGLRESAFGRLHPAPCNDPPKGDVALERDPFD
jgi:hypothetical protein